MPAEDSSRPGRPDTGRAARGGNLVKRVSSRAANPIGSHEDPERVFCDSSQVKATTATRLFRDAEMFRALRNEVIGGSLERHRSGGVSVWSAGCSSGEEVYSLAMVALDELEKRGVRSRPNLFGTDINRERLGMGKRGEYLSPPGVLMPEYDKILKRYAARDGSRIRIGEEVRPLIKFGAFDLRKCPRRHTFDFIVCNHVLQYYEHDVQLQVIANFISVLRPGGCLYIEGITAPAVQGAKLQRVDGYRNVYRPG